MYAEQGLGDTIQFARYLPMVKDLVSTVLFECQPALAGLLADVAGADQVIAAGAICPSFDVQVPLLSLPGLFHTKLRTIPDTVPYVHADMELVKRWGTEIGGNALNVGMIWQGSLNQRGDRRSLPLADFAPLARVPGARLVSLQVGPGREQIAAAPFSIMDLGGRFSLDSLADLAAALMAVDLVVTVDTAGAHLAGALGVPVWLALPLGPDWRWLLAREDSPWYPSMRLFRQRALGMWAAVLERVAAELSVFKRPARG